ncbi:MAG TPA: NAD-dependent epimerase/dehydratase family protein, partial [Rhodothermales bacterium]|nr:NAD-dependent epimerase/dehydratase family protein [Rhodothermales bacterium]
SVTIWGTGEPRREFLHVDDLADACLFLMECYETPDPINIGVGEDISIMDLARLVSAVVGFEGRIDKDTSKPDGTPRKLLDTSRLNRLGWWPRIRLEEGLRQTYEWYRKSLSEDVYAEGKRDNN